MDASPSDQPPVHPTALTELVNLNLPSVRPETPVPVLKPTPSLFPPCVASIGADGDVCYPEDTPDSYEIIFPGLSDTEKRTRSFREFVRGTSIDVLIEKYEVDENTALRWIIDGNWNKKRRELVIARRDSSQMELEHYRQSKRQKHIEDTVDSAEKLRKCAQDMLDAGTDDEGNIHLKPGDLRSLGETLASAAKVAGQALGISEAGVTSENTEAREKAAADALDAVGSKVPLIAIYQNSPGGLPNVRTIQADVISLPGPPDSGRNP